MDVALGIVTFALLIVCFGSSVRELLERRMIRYAASFPLLKACPHEHRVPVSLSLTGEDIGDLCLDCDDLIPHVTSA